MPIKKFWIQFFLHLQGYVLFLQVFFFNGPKTYILGLQNIVNIPQV